MGTGTEMWGGREGWERFRGVNTRVLRQGHKTKSPQGLDRSFEQGVSMKSWGLVGRGHPGAS